MKFDFQFACDQLSSTNHSALLDVSSSASCQHILTMCIHICTYMDTLPLSKHIHRLPALAADLGHIFVMLMFSSNCKSVKSCSELALSNQMIGFLLLLFRKPISIL